MYRNWAILICLFLWLSPPQRPLLCCFVCKVFMSWPYGECWEGEKEKRGSRPLPSSHLSPHALPNPILLKNFHFGASAEERAFMVGVTCLVHGFLSVGMTSRCTWCTDKKFCFNSCCVATDEVIHTCLALKVDSRWQEDWRQRHHWMGQWKGKLMINVFKKYL